MNQSVGNKKVGIVFYISLALSILFAIWGIASPDSMNSIALKVFEILTDTVGWYYLIVVFAFLVFLIYIAFSKMGNIKLGLDDDKPEFSNLSWFSMLFSAGMGTGLLFWGVGEPISHFSSPPIGIPFSADAARKSLMITNFHWGLHAWAIYSVTALALAYFGFRKKCLTFQVAQLVIYLVKIKEIF